MRRAGEQAGRKREEGAGFSTQWPGKSLLRRDVVTEEEQAEGTAIVEAPKCAACLARCVQQGCRL